jgi:hypothetical protein
VVRIADSHKQARVQFPARESQTATVTLYIYTQCILEYDTTISNIHAVMHVCYGTNSSIIDGVVEIKDATLCTARMHTESLANGAECSLNNFS